MSLSDILQDIDGTPTSYIRASRILGEEEFSCLTQLNVAVLSTANFDLVRPYLVVDCARLGMQIDPYFAPFNQLEQEVLNANSQLYASNPDVVVVAARLEELELDLVERFISLSQNKLNSAVASIEARIEGLIQSIRQSTQATILFFNFAAPTQQVAGLADSTLGRSQASVFQGINDKLSQICRKTTGAFVFDYAQLVREFGQRDWQDPKLWYLGRIPISREAQIHTGHRLARYIRAAKFPTNKCLVLDLDNTLWGGVVGEDGVGGIALGEEYPGSVYKAFQRHVASLRDRGILLAIASKNNESDVVEAFEKHSDFILKLDDFAARQIHWDDKAISLKTIADELNIGTDSLAFFDDSPVEREWIKSQMPEVTVIEVPDDAMAYAAALEDSGAFDNLSLSSEDLQRPEMYRQESNRRELQMSNVSPDEFFSQLEMTATIGVLDSNTLPRVAQLVAKTNQFNLTNKRHTAPDLEAMTKCGALGLWMRLRDRFGDNGLVAVAVAIPVPAESSDSTKWKIDTFLMSCRVAGRKVESAFLGVLCNLVRDRGGKTITGEYISTSKNGMVSKFYQNHGFKRQDDEGRYWKLNLADSKVPIPDYISVTIEGDNSFGG